MPNQLPWYLTPPPPTPPDRAELWSRFKATATERVEQMRNDDDESRTPYVSPYICAGCGRTYSPNRHEQRYCSTVCAGLWATRKKATR